MNTNGETWWVAEGEGIRGPLTQDEVFTEVRVGKLDANSLLRSSAGAPWEPAKEVFPSAFFGSITSIPSKSAAQSGTSWRVSIPPLSPHGAELQDLVQGTFKEVFRRHDAGALVSTVAGRSRRSDETPRSNYPWIFARTLAAAVVTFFAAMLYLNVTSDATLLPVAVLVAAAAAPLTLLIFLWECAPPGSVSLLRILTALALGSVGATAANWLAGAAGLSVNVVGRLVAIAFVVLVLVAVTVFVARGLQPLHLQDALVLGAASGAGFIVLDRFWLWLGWGNEFFSLGFLTDIVFRYWWISLIEAPLWVAVAAGALWMGSKARGAIQWAAVGNFAFLLPMAVVVFLGFLTEQAAEVGIFNYPVAFALWLLILAAGLYVLFTYIVADQRPLREVRTNTPTGLNVVDSYRSGTGTIATSAVVESEARSQYAALDANAPVSGQNVGREVPTSPQRQPDSHQGARVNRSPGRAESLAESKLGSKPNASSKLSKRRLTVVVVVGIAIVGAALFLVRLATTQTSTLEDPILEETEEAPALNPIELREVIESCNPAQASPEQRGDPEVWAGWAACSEPSVRVQVASSSVTPLEVVSDLIDDPYVAVRIAVAQRDPLTTSLRDQLVRDPNSRVRLALWQAQPVAEIAQLLLQDPDVNIAEAAEDCVSRAEQDNRPMSRFRCSNVPLEVG